MKLGQKAIKEKAVMIISIVLALLSFGFCGYQFWLLREENLSLLIDMSKYETALSISQKRLASTTSEKLQVVNSLQKEKENSTIFANQIQNLAGTVDVLEKLSKTDTELLKKYSKVYFLNENYIPPKLVAIPAQYLFLKEKTIEIHEKVWPHLQSMLDTATTSGINIQVLSGYRSFGTQAGLKSTYKITYGAGTANKFSADQGYSEHQLGTTIDFTSQEIGGLLLGFEKTAAYTWMLNNAYKFGFTLSYPKGNTFYIFEPWHFRYVGIQLATKLHNENLNFYDLDQRDIDQYLVNFFD